MFLIGDSETAANWGLWDC